MLSRIADSLFWLNRYMERADGLLRVAYTHYNLSLDKGILGSRTWRPVLEIFTHCSEEEIVDIENNTGAALEKLLLDTNNQNSLKAIVTRARENARGAQDHITKEVWEEVNSVYHLINQPSLKEKLYSSEALHIIDVFSKHTTMYTGVTDITMPRGIGWSFMNVGKYVERCFETIIMVDKQFAQIGYDCNGVNDILQWRYLLLGLSGYELHLKTYRSTNYNRNVLHQVLFNQDFPHAVLYSLSRLDRYLKDIARENSTAENTALLRSLGRLHSSVKFMDPDTLNNLTLQQFLEDIKNGLQDFSIQLGQVFFSYS